MSFSGIVLKCRIIIKISKQTKKQRHNGNLLWKILFSCPIALKDIIYIDFPCQGEFFWKGQFQEWLFGLLLQAFHSKCTGLAYQEKVGYWWILNQIKVCKIVVAFSAFLYSLQFQGLISVICILRSWLHQIPIRIWHLFPGLENIPTFKQNSMN